jgi:hypothetical protein
MSTPPTSTGVSTDASVVSTTPVMTAATGLLSLGVPPLPSDPALPPLPTLIDTPMLGPGLPPLPSDPALPPLPTLMDTPMSHDEDEDGLPIFPVMEYPPIVLEGGMVIPISSSDTPMSPEASTGCSNALHLPMPELDDNCQCQSNTPCSHGDTAVPNRLPRMNARAPDTPPASAHATSSASNELPEMSADIKKQLKIPNSYKPGPHMDSAWDIINEYNITNGITHRDRFVVKLSLYDLLYIKHVLKAPEVADILRSQRHKSNVVDRSRKRRHDIAFQMRQQQEIILKQENMLALYAIKETRSTDGVREVDDLKRENARLKKALEESERCKNRLKERMDAAIKDKEEYKSKYKAMQSSNWRLKNPDYFTQRRTVRWPNTMNK